MSSTHNRQRNKNTITQIIQNNSEKIIDKMESQFPLKTQQFSEMYRMYIRMIESTFDSSLMYEKEMMAKFGMDKKFLNVIQNMTQFQTYAILQQMDYNIQYRKFISDLQFSTMNGFEAFMQAMLMTNFRMLK